MHIRTKRKIFIGFFIFIALLLGIIVTVYLAQQNQDTRQQASELTPTPEEGQFTASPSASPVACIPDEGTCEWDLVSSATSYNYKIIETDTGTVVKEGTVQAPTNSITFTIKTNTSYTCSVSAVNTCGTGEEGKATNSCIANTPTPTPTNLPTPTITPTPTEIPPTPTATPVPTSTPVPPVIEQRTQTVQQQQTRTVVQNQTVVQQSTPVPTIPPTGPVEVVVGIGTAAVIGIIGAVIFFIL